MLVWGATGESTAWQTRAPPPTHSPPCFCPPHLHGASRKATLSAQLQLKVLAAIVQWWCPCCSPAQHQVLGPGLHHRNTLQSTGTPQPPAYQHNQHCGLPSHFFSVFRQSPAVSLPHERVGGRGEQQCAAHHFRWALQVARTVTPLEQAVIGFCAWWE